LVPNAEERTKRDAAADWILDVLPDAEPHKYREIERLARDDGIERPTLHRARQKLGKRVVIERDESARGRPSTWRLVGKVSSRGGFISPPVCSDETKEKRDEIRGSYVSSQVSSHVPRGGWNETDGEMKPVCEQCGALNDITKTVAGPLCPPCVQRVLHGRHEDR
jgi:hypothetical protein